MTDEVKTLSCGHPKAEEAEPDGTIWCLVCAMYVQPEALDAVVVSSSAELGVVADLRAEIKRLNDALGLALASEALGWTGPRSRSSVIERGVATASVNVCPGSVDMTIARVEDGVVVQYIKQLSWDEVSELALSGRRIPTEATEAMMDALGRDEAP